jgi:hypothetical protein
MQVCEFASICQSLQWRVGVCVSASAGLRAESVRACVWMTMCSQKCIERL